MEKEGKMEDLLREYGYPEDAIPILLEKIGPLSFEKVEKLIKPYQGITVDKS